MIRIGKYSKTSNFIQKHVSKYAHYKLYIAMSYQENSFSDHLNETFYIRFP